MLEKQLDPHEKSHPIPTECQPPGQEPHVVNVPAFGAHVLLLLEKQLDPQEKSQPIALGCQPTGQELHEVNVPRSTEHV